MHLKKLPTVFSNPNRIKARNPHYMTVNIIMRQTFFLNLHPNIWTVLFEIKNMSVWNRKIDKS